MKLRRRRKAKPSLMLTSLLDMFTIILIFLIVSFEAEDYDFRLNPDLKLAESSARSVFKPAVNVAVTRAGVLVQDEQVAPLTAGEADAAAYDAGQIPAVTEALERVRAARLASPEAEVDEEIIMLQADAGLEYRTLYLVMRSARLAGYSKYRLTVMKK